MTTKPLRVVVVDDETAVRNMVSVGLGVDPRFEIIGDAANGHEAVQMCNRLRPDIVVMDVMMPRMNGITALRVLRCVLPQAAVVIHSAFPDLVEEDARQAGAAAVLDKGTEWDEFTDVLLEVAVLA